MRISPNYWAGRGIEEFRKWRLGRRGARFEGRCRIDPGVDARATWNPSRPGGIRVGRDCWLSRGVLLHAWGGRIHLGRNVFLGPYSVVYGHGGVEIGDDCLIAMHCRIVSANHALAPRSRHTRWMADKKAPVRLGPDVWLGAGVAVLAGVVIGRGAIVGAGAVVTRDIPEYAVAHGVPARVVGERPQG